MIVRADLYAVFTNDLATDAEGRRAIQDIGRAIVELRR